MRVKTIEPVIASYLSDKAIKNKIPLSAVRLNYLLFVIWIVKCVM